MSAYNEVIKENYEKNRDDELISLLEQIAVNLEAIADELASMNNTGGNRHAD